MAYQLSKLRQDVRTYLDDDEYDASVINQAINDYQRELFMNYDLRLAETSTNLTQSTSSSNIALPGDFIKALGIQNITADYERDLTPYELDNDLFYRKYLKASPDSGTPLYFTVFGTDIIADKPADVDYTIRLLYLRFPPTLSDDSDVPLVPEVFEEMMKLGAVERIFRREDEYRLSNAERTVLTNAELAFVRRYGRGMVSSKPHIMRKA